MQTQKQIGGHIHQILNKTLARKLSKEEYTELCLSIAHLTESTHNNAVKEAMATVPVETYE